MELRSYQIDISDRAAEILKTKKIVCLFMEVRTGKTLTALETCKKVGAKRILFITKIKAFSSINTDTEAYNFDITIINRESLHKVESDDFDVVIIDEVHGYSAYPKLSKSTKEVRQRFGHLPMILLSGTPTPESFSQYFHIFYLSNATPFEGNFYKWAKQYVNIKQKRLGYAIVNDYSDAEKDKFFPLISDFILTFTQAQAGFETVIKENVLYCEMSDNIVQLIKKLKSDKFLQAKDGRLVMADTGAKMQSKVHQLCSGTVIFEDKTYKIIDTSKGDFIKNYFKGKKIGIFYKFTAELELLKSVFKDELTTALDEFNSTDKNIALQIVSGREGISLKNADFIVFYNIDFSAVSYFQARDRMTTMDRRENSIFWIFSKGGIENDIYKTVQNKKDFTLSNFKQWISKIK